MKKATILAVVGAQYGSEGKGNIVSHIAHDFNCHVRTGGPNAGHSFQHRGVTYKQQCLPCGWTNRRATLVIGAGGLLDLPQFIKEIQAAALVDPEITDRIYIDSKCGILDALHSAQEGGTKGQLHKRIGSTGKGVGAARHARMNRDPMYFKHAGEIKGYIREAFADAQLGQPAIRDTVRIIRSEPMVLLEGTQGAGLSLVHGPWPYVTSADTNAAQMAADAGIPPQRITDVMLVARTYPIRVAGNSGPLKDELTWDEMNRRMGTQDICEQTTVTKLTRRIGEWDWNLFRRAVLLNDPNMSALNFCDYMNPDIAGTLDATEVMVGDVAQLVFEMEAQGSGFVEFLGTGGPGWSVAHRGV